MYRRPPAEEGALAPKRLPKSRRRPGARLPEEPPPPKLARVPEPEEEREVERLVGLQIRRMDRQERVPEEEAGHRIRREGVVHRLRAEAAHRRVVRTARAEEVVHRLLEEAVRKEPHRVVHKHREEEVVHKDSTAVPRAPRLQRWGRLRVPEVHQAKVEEDPQHQAELPKDPHTAVGAAALVGEAFRLQTGSASPRAPAAEEPPLDPALQTDYHQGLVAAAEEEEVLLVFPVELQIHHHRDSVEAAAAALRRDWRVAVGVPPAEAPRRDSEYPEPELVVQMDLLPLHRDQQEEQEELVLHKDRKEGPRKDSVASDFGRKLAAAEHHRDSPEEELHPEEEAMQRDLPEEDPLEAKLPQSRTKTDRKDSP